jgi:hypothetical protein
MGQYDVLVSLSYISTTDQLYIGGAIQTETPTYYSGVMMAVSTNGFEITDILLGSSYNA